MNEKEALLILARSQEERGTIPRDIEVVVYPEDIKANIISNGTLDIDWIQDLMNPDGDLIQGWALADVDLV